MASRQAGGEALRRIKHALSLWNCSGYVEFDDKSHIHEWLERELDRARYSNRELARLLHKHVDAGGIVKEQDNVPGKDASLWYSIDLHLDQKEVFIKFILEPDEPDEPGILIVSIH